MSNIVNVYVKNVLYMACVFVILVKLYSIGDLKSGETDTIYWQKTLSRRMNIQSFHTITRPHESDVERVQTR